MVYKIVEINEKLRTFESEKGDLQKLNIIIQCLFLSLNSLYIAPLVLAFKKNCNTPFGASNIIKICQFDKHMKKICSLKMKWGDSSTN
jgi:hypothetical protein